MTTKRVTPGFTVDLTALDVPEGTKFVTQDRDGRVDAWTWPSRPYHGLSCPAWIGTTLCDNALIKPKQAPENLDWKNAITEWPMPAAEAEEPEKPQGHIHAPLMEQYAQDAKETDRPWERWQCSNLEGTDCFVLSDHPTWTTALDYRRKPRTITINGMEVPEPMREKPAEGKAYWTFKLSGDRMARFMVWGNDEIDRNLFSLGLAHSTREAAETHARALLSFTSTEK